MTARPAAPGAAICAALVCGLALLAAPPAAPAAAGAPMFETDRPIAAVAASGRQVAVLVGCRRITLLRVGGSGRRVLKPARIACASASSAPRPALAFDGRQVSFRAAAGARFEERIFTAPMFPPTRPFQIDRGMAAGQPASASFAGPRGGAGTSAYLRLTETAAELRVVGAHGQRTLAALEPIARLFDVRGRRFVVAVGPELRVLDRTGAVRTRVPAGGVLAAAVLGTRVLLLRADRVDRLEADGTVSASLPLKGRARSASAFTATATVAAYTDGATIRAVRLRDGRDVPVAFVPPGRVAGSGLVGIAFGSAGLIYARNGGCRAPGDCHGEVRRISNAALDHAFSGAATS